MAGQKKVGDKVVSFNGQTPSRQDLRKNVTRGEFIEVLTQISENINEMAQFQMDDLNTMYAKHLFPNEIKMSIMEEIIIEKLGITSEELTAKYNERVQQLQEQAKELKEKQEAKTDAE